jgi:predicted ATP-dependent serine protease
MKNVNDSLENISIDHKVLGFCLNHDFFKKVRNILEEDMFSGQTKELFKTILFAQTNYEKDLTKDELFDFPFDWSIINEVLQGMWRGNLGIIFARPEVGKTTFCAFLCASYVKQKKKIIYWANEEPSELVKLRIIQSYFAIDPKEMHANSEKYIQLYRKIILPYLKVMSCAGTSIEEVNDYAQLNKPDIMFCDQLDKFKVRGDFSRGDERLKEIYIYAREIAKRNNLLMWAISQASYDGHDRAFIDYAMLDGSKTGKAGEADVIIGLGKTGSSEVENNVRHICISKNKITGWHGMLNCHIDTEHAIYY